MKNVSGLTVHNPFPFEKLTSKLTVNGPFQSGTKKKKKKSKSSDSDDSLFCYSSYFLLCIYIILRICLLFFISYIFLKRLWNFRLKKQKKLEGLCAGRNIVFLEVT